MRFTSLGSEIGVLPAQPQLRACLAGGQGLSARRARTGFKVTLVCVTLVAMNDKRTRLGFLLAGLYNLGIIVFSRGFSNVLGEVDPLFGSEGAVLIALWGLAYMGLRDAYKAAPMVVGVFCVEKVFYAQHWAVWLAAEHGNLGDLFASDPMSAAFFSVYGLGDAAFAVFFGLVAWRHRRRPAA